YPRRPACTCEAAARGEARGAGSGARRCGRHRPLSTRKNRDARPSAPPGRRPAATDDRRSAVARGARATANAPRGPVVATTSPRVVVLAALALVAIVLVAYGATLDFAFQLYDDNAYVVQNPFVQNGLAPSSIAWAFRDDGEFRRMWHPLTMLSHMLDVQLWGMRPGLHHLTSVLVHAVTVSLLFLFLQRETGRTGRAWCVAALFALHPLNVEPVAWIAQRKTLLAGCFWVATLLAYGAWVRRPSPWRYRAALLWYVLGWLSKP